MKPEGNVVAWAESVFGDCDLGDERRVGRLVEVSALMAWAPGASIASLCGGDRAAREGMYRFLRNPHFDTADIDEGACMAAAEVARDLSLVLAVQDTTGVSFTHPAGMEFAENGCPTGFLAHTTLLVDPENKAVLGLGDQERWMRAPASKRPGAKTRKQRPYEEKESYRWEQTSRRVHARLDMPGRVMDVGDRETDIFEYLHYLREENRRFTLRADNDRILMNEAKGQRLWSTLEAQPVLGLRTIVIEQRGGQAATIRQKARPARKRRRTVLELRAKQVTIKPPDGKRSTHSPVTVNAVLITERHPPEGSEALSWLLLTSEPIDTIEQVNLIVHYYECRWLIEPYFKALKSGCQVERRPLQQQDRLDRMIAICSHVAVRLAQLHCLANQADDKTPCDAVLTADEYHCLWASTNRGKRLPRIAPSARWAFEAIGRLAGWTDSKRTGRIGWQTVWRGWDTLQQRMVGWAAAKQHAAMTDDAKM